MSDMFSAYTTLFRTPGAMKFSISALIGRMPISMDSLALIFIVVAVCDSYALAGALSAVASITVSIANPFAMENLGGVFLDAICGCIPV
jgi:hypothetical protein